MSTLFRLRNLRLVTEAELDQLKALDDRGKGRQLAERLGLPEPDHTELRGDFKHRILGLGLEAFRRDEVSYGKLREIVAMVGVEPEGLARLLEDAGIDPDSPSAVP